MKHAAYDITELKADGSGPKGLFAALVSVFGNVDRNGDRVMPGAFTKTLEKWRKSGKPIPVIWSHEHDDPGAYIGEVDPNDVKETKDGLVVAGRLHIDTNPRAAQIYDLLQKNLVTQWSFAYEVKDERLADDLAREIYEAELFEIGPTLVGANPLVDTLQLASAQESDVNAPDVIVRGALSKFEERMDELVEEKLGRVLSAKTEARIRSAMTELESILSALGEPDEEIPQTEQAAAPPPEVKEPTPSVESLRLRREQQLSDLGLYLAQRGV